MRALLFLAVLGHAPVADTAPSIAAQSAAEPSATAQSGALDEALLVAHPGLSRGDFDAVREDWLRALEQEPNSALGGFAAQRLAEIGDGCTQPLDAARIDRLQPRLADPLARAVLADLRLTALSQQRARGLAPDAKDVYGEWLREWRVAGPWGPLDATHPLAAPVPLSAVDWVPARREANRDYVVPDAHVFPAAGGLYAALVVRGTPGDARLLLDADEAFLAWWNGKPVAMQLRRGLTDIGRRHEAQVHLEPGWNLLLIASPGSSALYLGARLVQADGRPLAVEELDAVSPLPPALRALRPTTRGFRETVEPPPVPTTGSLGVVVAMHRERLRDRSDRALRLAAEQPAASDTEAQVLRLRATHLALQSNRHLPYEVTRSHSLATEDALLALDALGPRVGHARAQRLLDEDRPGEALTLLRELQARFPNCPPLGLLEAEALAILDVDGVLAEGRLRELHAAFPAHIGIAEALRDAAGAAGARAEEERWARVARRLGAAGTGNWQVLLDRAVRRADGSLAELRTLADAWRAAEPANGTAEWLQQRCRALAGRDAELLDDYRDAAQEYPAGPDGFLSLGEQELRIHGADEAALNALREALAREPSAHEARMLLQALRHPADDAEEFFASFGPDVRAALARRGTTSESSTALLLDHGMVYVLPDGGFQYRTHVLAEAIDRAGTERLHEQAAAEHPLVTRVHDLSGQVFEPHQVEGTWVMPSLDPGDVVERVWDRFEPGLPGVVPVPGSWRFGSFQEPFLLSRWVIYVPDGVPGELRLGNFPGEHRTERWHHGTVHVLEVRDSARREPEVMMPSELEVLPWAEFGEDRPESESFRSWWDWLRWQSSEPADVALELAAFAAEHADDGGILARAEALHAAVARHVLDFADGGDVTDVWTQRRGDPTGLLAALYRHAGVPFEWALAASTAAELDPAPVRPFASGADFGVPLMRIAGEDGQVVWLLTSVRGTAFGDLPPSMAGAPVRVLEAHPEDGPLAVLGRPEWIPLHAVEDAWDLDFQVRYQISGADAAAQGSIRISGVNGAALREQLAQAPPEQLDGAARQICASLVDGLDLETADFAGLQQPGAPLLLEFRGRVPGFVRTNAAGQSGARLRLPELGLSNGLGPAERALPFAFRRILRLRGGRGRRR